MTSKLSSITGISPKTAQITALKNKKKSAEMRLQEHESKPWWSAAFLGMSGLGLYGLGSVLTGGIGPSIGLGIFFSLYTIGGAALGLSGWDGYAETKDDLKAKINEIDIQIAQVQGYE